MILASPGQTIYPTLDSAPEDLVPDLSFRFYDPADDSNIVAETTSGVELADVDDGTVYVFAPGATAPTSVGVYRVVWDHPDLSSPLTEPVYVRGYSLVGDPIPTVYDVASLLPRRWRTEGGNYAEVPSASTSPTEGQVGHIITQQAAIVLAATGDVSTEALVCADVATVRSAVAAVIAARAAHVIERTFWPEEVEQRDTVTMWQQILSDQAAVVSSARECRLGAVVPGGGGEGEGGVAVAPVYGFERQTQPLSF